MLLNPNWRKGQVVLLFVGPLSDLLLKTRLQGVRSSTCNELCGVWHGMYVAYGAYYTPNSRRMQFQTSKKQERSLETSQLTFCIFPGPLAPAKKVDVIPLHKPGNPCSCLFCVSDWEWWISCFLPPTKLLSSLRTELTKRNFRVRLWLLLSYWVG